MVTFICLFFPAALALAIYEKLRKNALSVKQTIYFYVLFNIIVNTVCFFVKSFILKTGGVLLTAGASDMTPSIAFNYLVIAVPVAIVVAFVALLLTKTCKVDKE